MALLVVLGKFHGKIFCHLHWHCEKNRFDLRHTQHLVGLKDILQATFLEGDFCRCHDVLPCDSLVTREIHPASMQDGWKISFFPLQVVPCLIKALAISLGPITRVRERVSCWQQTCFINTLRQTNIAMENPYLSW